MCSSLRVKKNEGEHPVRRRKNWRRENEERQRQRKQENKKIVREQKTGRRRPWREKARRWKEKRSLFVLYSLLQLKIWIDTLK